MDKKAYLEHRKAIVFIWKSLTPGERDELTNGCGPMNNRFLAKVIPELIFNIFCKIHDIAFLCGGRKKHFKYSNKMFYDDMCKAIIKQTKWKRWFYYAMAKGYVWFVSSKLGKKSFSYRDRPLNLKEVRLKVSES